MAKDFAKRTATPAPADSNGGGGVKIAWFASGMLVGV
ncbi:MAG: hypothetical protein ACJAR0_003727, partial [Candidatus Azotimanducaceae bacterium]